MNEKKIGIVTYWDTEENYGQVLQLFALQWQLKKLNCSPFLVRILSGQLPPDIDKKYSTKKITLSKIVDAIKKRLSKKYERVVVNRDFQMFKDRYLSVSEKAYTPKEIYQNAPDADVYICGSDQVWNYPNPIFFLDWCPKGKKRVSYAASFGKSSIPDYQEEAYSKLLTQFDMLSVREKSGIEICNRLVYNKKCIQCLDPTLLLSSQDYCSAINIKRPSVEKKYILLYLLGNKSYIDFDKIDNFAKNTGCEIVFVPSQGCVMSRYESIYPTIEQWLGLVKNADYVITNSFHGTVFSIIFKKQFYVLPLIGGDCRMNDRLNSLFETLGIQYRFFDNNNIENLPMIDYYSVNKKLENLVCKSISYISDIFTD